MRLLLLPLYILKFWYLEAPLALFAYFMSLNRTFLNLFSLPLMLRTFFRPWKNEYRKEFVRFSIFMGMAFKTILIAIDLILFLALIIFELALYAVFLAWPILTVYLLFVKF